MRIRKARFAGSWYTGDPVSLRAEIDEFLELAQDNVYNPAAAGKTSEHRVNERIAKGVRGGMLPHAGIYFSGRGIAHFFNALRNETENIVIVSPSHYVPLNSDTLYAASFDYYDTPIGRIQGLDMTAQAVSGVQVHEQAVAQEHAVEMFLPFIARAKEVSKRPLTVGVLLLSEVSSPDALDSVASAAMELLGEDEIRRGNTVLIASSDYTHYGPRFGHTPFGTRELQVIEHKVEQQDREAAEHFASYQFARLFELKKMRDMTICGFAPGLAVAKIMETVGAEGAVTDYYTSNQFVGPDVGFVAYCSILWR